MDIKEETKKILSSSNCECCGFKRGRNSTLNKKSCGIKKSKALTVIQTNEFLTKQIEELENELKELLEQRCECDAHT